MAAINQIVTDISVAKNFLNFLKKFEKTPKPGKTVVEPELQYQRIETLMYMIKCHDHAGAKCIIAQGLDIDKGYKKHGRPLLHAIHQGDIEMIQLLLDNGSKVMCNSNQCAAIEDAIHYQNVPILKLLLSQVDDIHFSTCYLHPLRQAIYYENTAMLESILAAGCSPNAGVNFVGCPMHVAIVYNNIPAMNVLIKYGIDLNHEGKTNYLLEAMEAHRYEMVLVMIRAGAKLIDIEWGMYMYESVWLCTVKFLRHFVMYGGFRNVESVFCGLMHFGSVPAMKLIACSGFSLHRFLIRSECRHPLRSTIREWKRHPLTLKELCRVVILNRIVGLRYEEQIDSLEVPREIHGYLKFEDFECLDNSITTIPSRTVLNNPYGRSPRLYGLNYKSADCCYCFGSSDEDEGLSEAPLADVKVNENTGSLELLAVKLQDFHHHLKGSSCKYDL